eukprot:Skav221650  [mRNA]  locus=scaffold1174:299942:302029:- [translate_table: standard]
MADRLELEHDFLDNAKSFNWAAVKEQLQEQHFGESNVFRTDGDQKATHRRKEPLSGSQGLSASQRTPAVSSRVSHNSLDSDEALGFSEDTSADPAVIQEMQKERQPAVLTKEEVEEAAAWRVEGSSRAGFKVFRQVKEEFQSDQGSRKRKKRSRSRGKKSGKDRFPDL